MKKKISFVLCIVMIATLLFSLTGCSESDYARITDMDYTARVVDTPGSDGKIVITEKITFDVHAASRYDGFWELWRDLCENYIDGLKVYYNVLSVKQVLPDGTKINWPESPQLYWDDSDYLSSNRNLGPGKWFHSPGPYDEYKRQYECLLFYVDNLYREKITFEIEYEMYNAVLRYGDCSELYISMYSGETIEHLKSLKGQILIPIDKMPRKNNYKALTYGTNGGDFPIEESSTKNPGYYTFYFDLSEKDLKFSSDNEFIEFDLVTFGEDKHIFSEYASMNDYYYDEALGWIENEQMEYKNSIMLKNIIKIIAYIISIIIAFVSIISSRRKVKKIKNKNQFYSPDVFDSTFRDIPSDLDPNFAANLVFCKDKKGADEGNIYSALLLSLARKKYIELKEISTSEIRLYLLEPELPELEPIAIFKDGDFEWYHPKQPDPREPLSISEEYYLNLIKRHAKHGSIAMDELQDRISLDYNYTSNFAQNIKKSISAIGVQLKYFSKSNYLEPRQSLMNAASSLFICEIILIFPLLATISTPIFPIFASLVLSNLYSGYYLSSQSHKFVALTKLGEEEYRKWRGLYNFLKSDTLINERTIVELPLWEKYLVYATAFGISEKVTEAIKIRCPEVISGNSSSTSIVHSSYCRSSRIRTHGSSFRSSVHHGSTSYSSFSGSSSHSSHGYGGGGRGGGGGGGGH